MERRSKIETALRSIGADQKTSRDAYSTLYKDGREVVRTYLRYRSVSNEDAEEISQNIFLRVWDNWHRLQFESLAQWYAYLYTAARNALRDNGTPSQTEPSDEIPDSNPNPQRIIEGSIARQRFYDLADEIWLGMPPENAAAKRLVAKYLYVDGKSYEEVLKFAFVCSAEPGERSVDGLRKWLSSVWLIRRTAFDALYVTGDKLVTELLGMDSADARDLDALTETAWKQPPQDHALGPWKWGEVLVILLRFRYGMPVSQMMRRLPEGIQQSQALEVTARCTQAFPFVTIMSSIWKRLGSDPLREKALGQNPLWKRLAFQYHFAHELAQDDILERISGPAAVAGYALNYINTWIAGRLADELVKHLNRTGVALGE